MAEALDLILRPYSQGDEKATQVCFQAAFGRELPLDFWTWRFKDNPAGGPWVEAAFDGDVMAAHYAATATRLSVNGRLVPAGLSMMTMTHPNYQGRGLFSTLGERLYARMAEAGLVAAFGFPNANVHRGRRRALAWGDVYEIPTLRLDLPTRARLKPAATVMPVEAFDARFDRLWDRVKAQVPLWTWRDAAYLDWRFTRHPTNTYSVLADVDGDEVRGYVVTKSYLDQGVDIVDLVGETDAVVIGLVHKVVQHAQEQGVRSVVCWMLPHLTARPDMESLGFVLAAPITYLGGRKLLPMDVDLFDPRVWNIQMSDSDVY